MNIKSVTVLSSLFIAALVVPVVAQTATRTAVVSVSPAAARPAAPGPEAWFTGSVTITPLFDPLAPGRTGAALVRFSQSARTAWHTHPLGQRLVVTEGLGRVGQWGGPTQEFRPGDVVTIPAGTKHWHGASPTESAAHIAIQESQNGTPVKWLEKVTDEQYGIRPQDQ